MSEMAEYNDVTARYFERPGPKNTEAVLQAVSRRAKELGTKKVVVASCTGRTAFTALEILDSDVEIVAVSHVTGFREPNHQELPEEARQELESKGASVLTCQHAFGGIGRAVRNKVGTYQVDEIVAYTLRTFGQGTKVAIELTMMAADAGLIRTDEDVISIGGTGKGADTALLLRPVNSFNFFDLRVKEVICKPRGL
jgi:hypothetical protein